MLQDGWKNSSKENLVKLCVKSLLLCWEICEEDFKKEKRENYVLLIRFTTCVLILESTYRHQATIDDEVVSMEILDTAGQVRGCKCCSPVPWLGYAAGEEIVVVAAVQWGAGVPYSGDTDFLLGRTPSLLPRAGPTPFCKGSGLEEQTNQEAYSGGKIILLSYLFIPGQPNK